MGALVSLGTAQRQVLARILAPRTIEFLIKATDIRRFESDDAEVWRELAASWSSPARRRTEAPQRGIPLDINASGPQPEAAVSLRPGSTDQLVDQRLVVMLALVCAITLAAMAIVLATLYPPP